AERLFGATVDGGYPPIEIERVNDVVGVLEQVAVPFLALLERLVRSLPLGDVAENRQVPAGADVADGVVLEPPHRSVGVAEANLAPGPRTRGLQEIANVALEKLLVGQAEQGTGGRVGGDGAALVIADEEGGQRRLEDGSELSLGLAERVVGLSALDE